MFNFMKKGDEKEKRKKDKDVKKKRERDGLTSDETRFEDVRRSLKIRRRNKDKLPSGITADYRDNLFAEFNREVEANKSGSLPGYASRSDSSESSINSMAQPPKALPPLPPKPPKRGILKGPRTTLSSEISQGPSNQSLVERNTLQNEVITYQNLPETNQQGSLFLNADKSNLLSVTSSAESLTDTTNSSFATPPLLSPTEHPPPPPIISIELPSPRRLTIQRTSRGDFGFQLRRAVVFDKLSGAGKKEVLFAEPGSLGCHRNETGLLPGDALLEVNGFPVQDKAREQIIDMIKSSGQSVKVKVQPIAELCEISRRCRPDDVGTLKRTASLEFRSTVARSEEELAKEKAWMDTEKLWLIHRSGYSAAKLLTSSPASDDGKVKVSLDNSDDILEVQEEDLERANPPHLDTVQDLSELKYVNESSILHTLRQRFGNNLIHTFAASNLVVVNPECPLSIYNEKVASLFLGCNREDMPPHIYATAQAAYRAMVLTRRDQSVVLLGRSGSGKTHNFRHILSYFLMAAGSPNKILSAERLNALHVVFEAFGNAKTSQNLNASKCTNLISLDFDHSRQIVSASVQMLMLEKNRVTERASGDCNFHVLYYILAGVEGNLSKQLFLDSLPVEDNSYMTPVTKIDDRQKYQVEFSRLCLSLASLGVSEKEMNVIWSVLAAIYHLGHAGVVRVGTLKWQFADPASASRAARLLGVTLEELSTALWDAPTSPTRNGTVSPNQRDLVQGVDALDGFVMGLYAELVNVVNALINRCLSTNVHTTTSLVVLDAPGFQSPNGLATFTDLCHNYFQERLHLLYHNSTLIAPLDRYTQERVDVDIEELYTEQSSPSQLVSILDKPPPGGVLKTSQTDLRDVDRRGLLWLTEEETVYPNSSDDTLYEHIFNQYGSKEFSSYIKKWSGNSQLCIQHLVGSCPTIYNVRGWLRASKELTTVRAATTLLQESSREDVSELFIVGRGGGGMFSPEGASQSLRRVSSIRRTCSAAVKRKSFGLQVKHTADSVIETLRRTRMRFVFCFSPQQWSGLGDGLSSTPSGLVNIPLLRSQVRAAELLPAVRIYKQGYPDHLPHSEFIRRFRLLGGVEAPSSRSTSIEPSNSSALPKITVSTSSGSTSADEIRLVEEILYKTDVDEASYRIGLSETFFRIGILPQLEAQRDVILSGMVVNLQSLCRGYLARRKFAKLKVQDTAVRCIQRNVRKLMQVREWPWWRLYVKIAPVLKVHRTEEELTVRSQALEALKLRFEKLEADNSGLRLDKDKLEAKLNEMTADLTEERASGSQSAERLEAETAERIRLEQELSQVSDRKSKLEQTVEQMELELYYAKADVNGLPEGESDWEDGRDGSMYKQKCARLMREVEMLRSRLQQQHEDDLEQLVGLKKQLEKKLADAYEEVDEQRQIVAQWKRKSQKLQAEMNDLRLILEEQNSRNNLLEKKQRKFDTEIQMLHDELRSERNLRERVSREREVAVGEKYSLEQSLSSVRLELELKDEKLGGLSRELEELSIGGATEQDISILRKIKHDLELKIKDQEDELDDLAGQVSILESAKLKMEMSLENIRKEHRKEIAQKDEEIDDIRSNSMKKVKAVEAALEQEHEERSLLLREKHELERRLKEQEERGRNSRAAEEDTLIRLRKDLRKTKALLRDANVMLDRAKQESPSKATLRSLKNQLEDSELARASAVKAKQSIEAELSETTSLLDEASKGKSDAESRAQAAVRQANTLRSQLEENEEELSELMKKYRQALQHLASEQARNQETVTTLSEVELERNSLREQLAEMTARLETAASVDPTTDLSQRRLETKIKDLESRLELEATVRSRLEVQISRLKENIERVTEECNQYRTKEQTATDQVRKTQRYLRECKEELALHVAREQEANQKKRDLEKKLEAAEQETASARNDLRLSIQRVQDLQHALSAEISSDSDLSSDTEIVDDSDLLGAESSRN